MSPLFPGNSARLAPETKQSAALRLSLLLALSGLGVASTTTTFVAGAAAQSASEDEDADATAEETTGDEESEDGEEPRLRAPDVTVASQAAEAEEEEDEEAEAPPAGDDDEDDELPDPSRTAERLDGAGSDPSVAPWTTPQTVFEAHGYMRMRGEFQDQFFLGRNQDGDTGPFSYWIPGDDRSSPAGGCAGGREVTEGASGWSTCDQNALAYANMRLRVEPTIHLSDDVRVHAQLDFLDNVVMGSSPSGLTTNSGGQDAISDSIFVRRAWAEVRNRGLGELRFGRMGAHWGLGMLFNDGRGIDQDYQSDVDRIMAITRVLGIYAFGAWDFASEGVLSGQLATDLPAGTLSGSQGLRLDRFRNDDVDQMVFGVARRMSPEEQEQALERHDFVLNAGALFMYRTQNLSSQNPALTFDSSTRVVSGLVRRGYESYTADVWAQFLYEDLRLEVEGAMVLGTIDNLPFETTCTNAACVDYSAFGSDRSARRQLVQFGATFDGEYHLLNRQLGIYFNAGIASGDRDQEGLSLRGGSQRQINNDGTLSNFYFHPAYRVDLILFRNILGQINGAYYFRPGLSYDFIRNNFGQLLGARADVVWSRAVEPIQTYGNQPDLGVEIDVQAYYRSEDGPDLLDGFSVALQYGILFPLGGLNYNANQLASGLSGAGQNAQTLRLVLGVSY